MPYPPPPGRYIIQQSTNDGSTWSTISTVAGDTYSYQPFLFEYPQQLGSYPAGTLMLFGATLPADRSGVSFRERLSFNDGATWNGIGVIQTSPGADGDGIWEPFVTLDSSGNLVLYCSDERRNATYSQFHYSPDLLPNSPTRPGTLSGASTRAPTAAPRPTARRSKSSKTNSN